jgi:hypothetical protein
MDMGYTAETADLPIIQPRLESHVGTFASQGEDISGGSISGAIHLFGWILIRGIGMEEVVACCASIKHGNHLLSSRDRSF